MQEQESNLEQTTTSEQDQTVLLSDRKMRFFRAHRSDVIGFVIIAACLAFLGIVCGAMNFVGPAVHYPRLILTIWFVTDLILVVFVLVHGAVSVSVFVDFNDESDVGAFLMMLGVAVGISLGVTWILLANRHFAWLSLILFLILTTFIVVDAWALYKEQK